MILLDLDGVLNPMTGASTKERTGVFETQSGIAWENRVKTEAESGVLHL